MDSACGLRRSGQAEEVGLELEERVGPGHPAVDPEVAQGDGQVGVHGVDQVGDLEGDPFEGRPGEVGDRGGAGQAEERPAGLGLPVRGAQAGQGGDEEDARVGVGRSERRSTSGAAPTAFRPSRNHCTAAPATKTLPSSAYRGGPSPRVGGQGRDQAPGRGDDPAPGVDQEERPGPVGALGLARLQAPLADQRRLLVARDPRIGRPSGR